MQYPVLSVRNTADYPNVPVTEEDTKAAVLATLSFLLEWHANWTAGARSMLQASLAYGAIGQILGASALLHQVSFWAENTPNEGQLPAEAFENWREDPSKIYVLTKYLTTRHLNHQHLKRQSAEGDSRQAFDSAESQTELNWQSMPPGAFGTPRSSAKKRKQQEEAGLAPVPEAPTPAPAEGSRDILDALEEFMAKQAGHLLPEDEARHLGASEEAAGRQKRGLPQERPRTYQTGSGLEAQNPECSGAARGRVAVLSGDCGTRENAGAGRQLLWPRRKRMLAIRVCILEGSVGSELRTVAITLSSTQTVYKRDLAYVNGG